MMEEPYITWYSAKDLHFNRDALPTDGGGFCEVLVGSHARLGKVALKRISVSAWSGSPTSKLTLVGRNEEFRTGGTFRRR